MKIFSTRLRHLDTKFLWKEISEGKGEIIGETFDGKELAIANLSEEYSADVDSVLKNEKPKNFIRRSYNKMKNFFKSKVFGIMKKKEDLNENYFEEALGEREGVESEVLGENLAETEMGINKVKSSIDNFDSDSEISDQEEESKQEMLSEESKDLDIEGVKVAEPKLEMVKSESEVSESEKEELPMAA